MSLLSGIPDILTKFLAILSLMQSRYNAESISIHICWINTDIQLYLLDSLIATDQPVSILPLGEPWGESSGNTFWGCVVTINRNLPRANLTWSIRLSSVMNWLNVQMRGEQWMVLILAFAGLCTLSPTTFFCPSWDVTYRMVETRWKVVVTGLYWLYSV